MFKNLLFYVLLFAIGSNFNPLFAQCDAGNALNLYWVGTTANKSGNFNDPSAWRVGSFAATVEPCQAPRSSDNVFLPEFTAPSAIITINQNSSCQSMSWDENTTLANRPTLDNAGNTSHFLDVYGSLDLSTNLNFNFRGTLRFKALTPTIYQFRSRNRQFRMASIEVDLASGAELQLSDDLRLDNVAANNANRNEGILRLSGGHFNTNTKRVNVDFFRSDNGAASRQLTITNSNINVNGWDWVADIWKVDFSSGNYAGFSTAGSHLVIQATYGMYVTFGTGTTYDSITIDHGNTRLYAYGNTTVNYFRLAAGTNALQIQCALNTNTFVQEKGSTLFLQSGFVATNQFIGPSGCDFATIVRESGNFKRLSPGGSLALNNVLLSGVPFDIGTGTTYTATSSANFGSTNIAVSAPVGCATDLYYKASASTAVGEDWNNPANWYTDAALTLPAAAVPTPFTNAWVVANSFVNSTGKNLTLASGQAGFCQNLTFVGTPANVNLNMNAPIFATGNVDLANNMNPINEGMSGWEMGRGFNLLGVGKTFSAKGVRIDNAIYPFPFCDYTFIDSVSTSFLFQKAGSTIRATNVGIRTTGWAAGRRVLDNARVHMENGWPCYYELDNSLVSYTNNAYFTFQTNNLKTVGGSQLATSVILGTGVRGSFTILGDLFVKANNEYAMEPWYPNSVSQIQVNGNVVFDPGTTQRFGGGAGSFFRANGNVTALGTCSQPITFGTANGNPAEFRALGTVSIDNAFIQNMTVPAANAFTVLNSTDGGGNTNVNFAVGGAGTTFYWRANRLSSAVFVGNWSNPDHWTTNPANTVGDGGCIPSIRDNVIFDNMSFSGGSNSCSITGDAFCKDFTCTAGIRLNGSGGYSGNLYVAGNFTLHPAVIPNYYGSINLVGTGVFNINTANVALKLNGFNLNNTGGTWNLQSPLTLTCNNNDADAGSLHLQAGTLNTNNFDMVLENRFISSNTNLRALNLGSSLVTLSGKGNYDGNAGGVRNPWQTNTVTNFTLNAGTSRILLLDGYTNSTIIKALFFGTGLTYNNIEIQDPNETINLTATNGNFNHILLAASTLIRGNNTVDSITLTGGYFYTFQAGRTTTLRAPFGKIKTAGAGAGNFINIESTVSNSLSYLRKAYGEAFCVDYVKIRDVQGIKETNLALVPTTPTDYQVIHSFLEFQTGTNSDSISGALGIWKFNLPPLSPPNTVGADTVRICKSGAGLSYPIQITGSSPYIINYSWVDNLGNTGSVSNILVNDDDNTPSTAFAYNVSLNPSASWFNYTVNVTTLRCGDRFASTPAVTHVRVPAPANLVAVARTGSCSFYNENNWYTIMDDVDKRPMLSLLDYTGAGDLDSLKNVDAMVNFDASTQSVTYASFVYPYLRRNWTITPTNNKAATVRIYFTQAELNTLGAGTFAGAYGGLNPATDLRVFRYSSGIIGVGVPQVIVPTVVTLSGTAAVAFASTSGVIGLEFPVPSFSAFIVVPTMNAVLPLNLTDFSVNAQDNKRIGLSWTVENSSQTVRYTVERSNDAVHAQTIGEVASRRITGTDKYEFLDNQPLLGVNYYRIKSTDANGSVGYSDWKQAQITGEGIANVYPNPAKNSFSIEFGSTLPNKATLDIYDALGRLQTSQVLEQGNRIQTIDTQALANGVYILKVRVQNSQWGIERRLIIQK